MTRDYRKGSPPPRRRKNEPRGTCAFWFLAGGLIGAFGVAVAWMLNDQPGGPQLASAKQPEPQQAEQPRPKPKFDFYDLLPNEEVTVPAEREPEPVPLPPPGQEAPPIQTATIQPAPAPTPTPQPSPTSGPNSYILQVGSFRRNSDAEELKAQLALLGIQSSIQTVTIDSGQTYHRVRTGPYAKADANALRAKLQSSGHKPMMMRAQ
ncbi:MAG: SPOR domain-containing protein [Thiohalocapsa sp.]|jgi:cell division protein FtsN|uniref:SPOR domain-containing protein n=1 Tax=Thiohalocapsa sp. TaxID=2497641 RepID=UPI0025FECFDA|nr:SPOR domain-containing protein [Thiohalocapsa sp.]MCG6940775.1 SPOR domain-containing protein [Thiohalocapsa sp.]